MPHADEPRRQYTNKHGNARRQWAMACLRRAVSTLRTQCLDSNGGMIKGRRRGRLYDHYA